jgi:hypothetical protein
VAARCASEGRSLCRDTKRRISKKNKTPRAGIGRALDALTVRHYQDKLATGIADLVLDRSGY